MANNRLKIQRITVLAMLSGIVILLAAIPQFGFITLGPLSLTILHIPVIIGGVIYGVFGGVVMGTVFGVSSWVISQIRGGVLDILFFNPLISIFPRIVFGLLVGGLSQILLKPTLKKNVYYWYVTLISFLTSVTHSFLVLLMIFIITFEGQLNLGTVLTQFWGFFAVYLGQALLEAVFAAFILQALVRILKARSA